MQFDLHTTNIYASITYRISVIQGPTDWALRIDNIKSKTPTGSAYYHFINVMVYIDKPLKVTDLYMRLKQYESTYEPTAGYTYTQLQKIIKIYNREK